jgi:hypothetical protein
MPYVTRDDGERFVIPSYRDVLSAKRATLLKKEIMLLSENYGGYIAIQKKNVQQYEIAFSPDGGYLLGETAWHYFKRPFDLIYCEVIPNTTEAILVIVKSGSVYLDGSFSIDSIPEELVVFLTQHNNFDVYIYGDVPISQVPEEGKFTFDTHHIKSFNVLTESAFDQLPKIKSFQLQPVDVALKAYGIGVFPIKQMIIGFVLLGLIWMAFTYFSVHKKEFPTVIVGVINPYQSYIGQLASSPAPSIEIKNVMQSMAQLLAMPGWVPEKVSYAKGILRVSVKSLGTDAAILLAWTKQNRFALQISQEGFYLQRPIYSNNRFPSNSINILDEVIVNIVDGLELIMPGNHLKISQVTTKGQYKEVELIVDVDAISFSTLDLISQQLKNLPLILSKIEFTLSRGSISGTITLLALGK